jgi:proline dehydrogenase
MLRQSLLFLSQSPTAQRLVSGAPLARQVAERFVAGETLDDAVAAARALNESGLSVTLDYLGESVSSRAEAEEATDVAIRTIERIAAEGIDGNFSLKPTQLGLDIDADFCRENIARILERAREVGDGEGEIFVRIDMESSAHTERTIELTERLWADGFRNTGTVLQSYLYRTDADLERLIALGTRIRLVKGAYNEPPSVAYPEKAEVDRHFIEQMQVLLERGNYPAIATHDEAIIAATRRFAWETGVRKDSFEFQMLYGIRRDLQLRLSEEGYNVRTYVPFGGSWYPYLMRRLAERPANVAFIASNLAKESPLGRLGHPVALGAGVVAGALAAMKWGNRRNSH